MSEFTVCRTADTHPALRYCLLLDGDRIAGGKPDYRVDNILISWNTKEMYGVVDALMKENAKLCVERDTLQENDAKLRELVQHLCTCMQHHNCTMCEYDGSCDLEYELRELGIEVE